MFRAKTKRGKTYILAIIKGSKTTRIKDAVALFQPILERAHVSTVLNERIGMIDCRVGSTPFGELPRETPTVAAIEDALGAEVYRHADKGSGGDTVILRPVAIASKRGRISVEEGRGVEVPGSAIPVPVRLCSRVAALVAEGGLVGVDKITVVRKELAAILQWGLALRTDTPLLKVG